MPLDLDPRAQDIMHIAYVSSLASTIQSAEINHNHFLPYNTTDHILPMIQLSF